jgi:hypothetical protein
MPAVSSSPRTLELFSTTWVTTTSFTLSAIPDFPLNASESSGRIEVWLDYRGSGDALQTGWLIIIRDSEDVSLRRLFNGCKGWSLIANSYLSCIHSHVFWLGRVLVDRCEVCQRIVLESAANNARDSGGHFHHLRVALNSTLVLSAFGSPPRASGFDAHLFHFPQLIAGCWRVPMAIPCHVLHRRHY